MAMIEAMPVQMDEDRVYRVGSTRVSLDSVVHAFNQGCTAEAIRNKFPTLELGDVYAAIGYYLNHQTEVNDYLLQRRSEADELREKIEALCPPAKKRAD